MDSNQMVKKKPHTGIKKPPEGGFVHAYLPYHGGGTGPGGGAGGGGTGAGGGGGLSFVLAQPPLICGAACRKSQLKTTAELSPW